MMGKMPVPPVRVADRVAETLFAHGVRHAFGMPGGEVVTLIDGLQRAGIGFCLSRHETAAAIMAAGASVLLDQPQVLVTTVGPGLANAVNGIADAAQERMPLIVLSGIVDRETRARYTHQVIDHAALLRPLVKASFKIEPESAAATVTRAIRLALTEPKGPVHLDLSPSVAAAPALDAKSMVPATVLLPEVSERDPLIAHLIERIEQAERPLVIAGFEAARSGCPTDLLLLAETIGAPVITTYKGKGLVPEDHPLALGGAGLSPKADRLLLPLIRQADLVLAFGYDPIEMRIGWMDIVDDPSTWIDVTALPADHAMHHAGLRIPVAPSAILRTLTSHLPRKNSWPEQEFHAVRQQLRQMFSGGDRWGPRAIVDVLQDAVEPDAVVTVDSGAHRILLSQQWICRKPLTLLQSAGFCTMAAALPLAIGAKLARPETPVFAVMGDGGLEMGIGELATLRDLGLPVTIVLFQDESLALIALKQASAGLPPLGVSLGQTDFAAVARGFGGFGVNVETTDDLRHELAAARERQTFSLICCRFDASAYNGAF
ncbi:thiamine pyrophosphate-binding protein [Affinirhizobium pseudoryzae]|uniref:thiamine pyrophosphate-binding protein n=1 Tax=Allorhizobium pseudoryzae TaxID=379684 RepID=UPI0013ED1D57|nr:thiamine pyrophosphate-binding protein [Allorhizobium pseudoryzae]